MSNKKSDRQNLNPVSRGGKDAVIPEPETTGHDLAEMTRSAPHLLADESDLLVSLYRTLIAHSELPAGLRSVLEIVCGFTGWAVGAAWLPADDEARIRFCTAWQRDDPSLAEFTKACQQRSFASDGGLPGRVWKRRAPEWIADLGAQSLERFPLASFAAQAGIKAAFGVPILHGDDVVGVLTFYMKDVREEDDSLIHVISRVAIQLGFALQHKQIETELRKREAVVRKSHDELEMRVAERTVQLRIANESLQAEILERRRLQEETQSRIRQQEAVVNIGQRVLSGASLAALFHEVCERVATTLDVEFCKILELQAEGQALTLRAGVGWRDGLVGRATVEAGTRSQAGYTLASSQPVIVEDLRTESRFSGPPLLLDHGIVSGVSVVIPGRDRAFGVLGAHSVRRLTFHPEHINFLDSVAHVLSQAIEQRRSESAIQRSESWLRHLVATTQDAVVSIDRRGCVALFNASAERIFGYTAAEIVGRKVNLLMAEPYASEHDGYVARYERTREPHAIGRIRKVTAKRKDGTEFPVELSVTEIEVDDEVHYAAFLRDVSETVELHARAVENERLAAIGGTAARIGHEIANPLNGIYLTLQLVEQRLARQLSPDERVAADVVKVKREIGRLNQLVQEFRTLARKQAYRFRPTHLPTLLDEVVDLQRPLCESSGITVVRRSAADLPAIDIDEDKLKQALLNLLKNAMEAMAHGGKLTIEVRRSGDDIIIEVSDTGTGITPVTDVFAPFFTTKKDGSGLGLIIVRQIVSAHGGAITYDSRAGEGTTFRITLPLSSSIRINAGE
ncbi:MAG: ATP-binding protein [Candidatus Binatia bacterium]